jgi:hypothetical protein
VRCGACGADCVVTGRPGLRMGGVGGARVKVPWGVWGESLSMVAEWLLGPVLTDMVDSLAAGSSPSPCEFARIGRACSSSLATEERTLVCAWLPG